MHFTKKIKKTDTIIKEDNYYIQKKNTEEIGMAYNAVLRGDMERKKNEDESIKAFEMLWCCQYMLKIN